MKYKFSKKLTSICKEMFGDIVLKAYYGYNDDSDIINAKQEIKNNINEPTKYLEISNLGFHNSLAVEFVNGKIVSFSVSEWGGIEKVKKHLLS